MIQKAAGWFAGLFWVFLFATFVMRLIGEWAGDPLVPLLGMIFILLLSAIMAGVLELQKQLELVKLGTFYNLQANADQYVPNIQKPDLN